MKRIVTCDGLERVDCDLLRIKRSKLTSTGTTAPTLILPSTSGTLALTSDVPGSSDYVTLDTSQSVVGQKSFVASLLAKYSAGGTPWTLPAYSFNGDTDSGMYLATDGVNYKNIGLSVDTKYVFAAGVDLLTGGSYFGFFNLDGSLLASFYASAATGSLCTFVLKSATNHACQITYPGTSNINVVLPSAGGTLALAGNVVDLTSPQTVGGVKTFSSGPVISSGSLTITNGAVISSDVGSVSNPVFSVGGTSTGMYAGAVNQLNFAVSGNSKFVMTTGSNQSLQILRITSGSLSSPGINFTTDTDTGIYQQSIGSISLVANGVAATTSSSTQTLIHGLFQSMSLATIAAGIQIGTNGTTRNTMRSGTGTTAAVVAATYGNQVVAVAFGIVFSSTPTVLASITNATIGSNINACMITVGSITTTGCNVIITNPYTADTSGVVTFSWQAWN